VLIDPLVEDDATWRWIERRRPSLILLGVEYHRRSVDQVVARVGAKLWSSSSPPPAGIEAIAVEGMDGGETAFYPREHRALVFSDAVIGAGDGKLQVAPPSWASDRERYDRRFRASLAAIATRPIDLVLVSHGPSVLEGGGQALRAALEAPAWG